MDNASNDIAEILSELITRHDDPDLLKIQSRICIDVGSTDNAETAIGRLSGYDSHSADSLLSELLLSKHLNKEALELAMNTNHSDPESMMILGIVLLMNGYSEESILRLDKAKESMIERGCIFRMDILLLYESLAHLMLNNIGKAQASLEIAIALCRNDDRKDNLIRLMNRLETYGSEDRVLLESIDIGYVQVPDVLYVPFEHCEPLEPESPC